MPGFARSSCGMRGDGGRNSFRKESSMLRSLFIGCVSAAAAVGVVSVTVAAQNPPAPAAARRRVGLSDDVRNVS